MDAQDSETLLIRIVALEADNRLLREALEVASYGRAVLASSQALTQVGRASLLASETAMVASQAETKAGQTDLLASETALAASQAETKEGQTDLLASETALAASQAACAAERNRKPA